MINYSIIIPHKNIPDLLQRCLDSIPVRDDVQIIVVDDNSDSSIVDFSNFPGLGRLNTEVYFTKEGKGAGYARNIGLDHAKGKWLLFIDADDFLSENAGKILDENVDSPYDLIFYDNKTVMSDDINVSSTRDDSSYYHMCLQDYLHNVIDDTVLRYRFEPLWGKILRHSVVSDNYIRFDEVKWSNDVYFSCMVGYYSKSIYVADEVLYIVTQRRGSLTSNFCGTRAEFEARLGEAIRVEKFLTEHGVCPSKLQSEIILRKYFNTQGASGFFSTMVAQRLLSPTQKKMLGFLLKILGDKITQSIL